ncbi:hypothetical protein ACEPPN_016476 [Leptodophora sp. 'Broadleaf-Isolate-01']
MHLTTLSSHILVLTLTILSLASNAVLVTPALAEDLQVVRGQILPPGYRYEPLRMTGTIGDITLNHTGTIEEILAKVADENPGFKLVDLDSTSTSAAGGHSIGSRDKQRKSDLACYPFPGQPDWRAAEVRYIDDGIAYLKKVTALCWVNGHACSRISCSYKSAITLCNVVSLPSFSED